MFFSTTTYAEIPYFGTILWKRYKRCGWDRVRSIRFENNQLWVKSGGNLKSCYIILQSYKYRMVIECQVDKIAVK